MNKEPCVVNKDKTLHILLLFSILLAVLIISKTHAASITRSLTGKQTAADMKKRFYDTADTCGNDPAWFCNGIIIRATNASPRYHAWEASPGAVERGGVSFSYFRSDLHSTRLQSNRAQGFTLKSGREGAVYDYPLEVLCSFPYDAYTIIRSHQGCGAAIGYTEESRECASQGITTAEKWLEHFNSVMPASEKRYTHQCSFNASTDAFATSLKARRLTNVEDQLEAWSQNELSIAAWPAGIGEQLPIESFFYVHGLNNGEMSGLKGAKYMQSDFFNNTGIWVPVIKITFPENELQEVNFEFIESDQSIIKNKESTIPDALFMTLLSLAG